MPGVSTCDVLMIDPRLFGLWGRTASYDGGLLPQAMAGGWSEDAVRQGVAELLLEIKSAGQTPGDALRVLLNDMTAEMRAQFDYFRELRSRAERLGGEGADDAAAKLARADVKAATDSMSLIVRTLEKIDVLQRQLARDRDLEAQGREDALGYEEARRQLLQLIEDKAEERARALLEQWQRAGAVAADGAPATGVDATGGTGPPATAHR